MKQQQTLDELMSEYAETVSATKAQINEIKDLGVRQASLEFIDALGKCITGALAEVERVKADPVEWQKLISEIQLRSGS